VNEKFVEYPNGPYRIEVGDWVTVMIDPATSFSGEVLYAPSQNRWVKEWIIKTSQVHSTKPMIMYICHYQYMILERKKGDAKSPVSDSG
jgi:hypothetical protein